MRFYLRQCGFLLILLLAVVGCGGNNSASPTATSPTPPTSSQPTPTPAPAQTVQVVPEMFVANANNPVKMAFAPDGRLFYNELKTGNVRVVKAGVLQPQPFTSVQVDTSGETGLLGIAIDPDFATNHFVWVLYSAPTGRNIIAHFADVNGVGTNPQVVFDQITWAARHNGGNIAFGPDGNLYVSTGENGHPELSQDKASLQGKILRFTRDGAPAPGNPFGNAAFALGLRNPFDFTFSPFTGKLFASENGPECDDEVDIIASGGNYGWRPGYPCGDTDPNFIGPLIRFDQPIAPTGITFYNGDVFPQLKGGLFLVDFKEGKVRHYTIDENAQTVSNPEVLVNGEFGPLLDITQGPDGLIYFSSQTSIVRLVPKK
jgi:glucose/arabinose dehydrogenase